jgi:hypothetical protein
MTIDKIVDNIVSDSTCGYEGCFNPPVWQLTNVHILTTDNGELELGGFKDIPINRVCQEHHDDKATAMLIANKAWTIVLRDIEMSNPGWLAKIGKDFRMTHFDLGWKQLG